MSVLLPTTAMLVLSPSEALDAHGHAVAYAWTQRGPYPANRSGHAPREEQIDTPGVTFGLTVYLDEAAWPVGHRDRLVDTGTDEVLEVVGATLRPDVNNAGIGHVEVACSLVVA